MPNKNSDHRSIEEVLASARAMLTQNTEELADLERQAALRKVRGTRDLAPVTAPALGTEPLATRLAELLKTEPSDIKTAATKLGVPVGRLDPIMRTLRDGLKIHNIGTEVEPCWQHVLGDDCSPADLRALVLRLIQMRPMTHRELVIVTGARDNRISGELANIREDPKYKERTFNLGDGRTGRWLVLPPGAQPAPLPRRNGKR